MHSPASNACSLTASWLLFFYVDDIGIIYRSRYAVRAHNFEQDLAAAFEINELGPIEWFLEIKVVRDRPRRRLWLSQSDYLYKVYKRFAVKQTSRKFAALLPGHRLPLVTTDEKIASELIHALSERVGSANWLAIHTRPDIAKACSLLAEHLKNPSKKALHCVGHLPQYLLQTKDLALQLGVNDNDSKSQSHTGVFVLEDLAVLSDASS